ncbi:hypothetical protein D7294_31300 [Streptomyces hoynatensis]|uniref:Uncharacterized protein n=1 Tax=Streptomyces hoynatensis TaxID=1141874 RepID=A0A3A9YCG7_9ACTN|nr:hypothetical protein D7294_31300 [Streptomyces hoynatensis]
MRRRLRRRRRPGESRAVVPGLSARTLAAIAAAERERLWPGAAHEAWRRWHRLVHAPGHGVLYPYAVGVGLWPVPIGDWWYPDECRAALETIRRAVPRRCAAELGALLAPLDERYLRRTLPDPAAPADEPWWRRRLLRP